MPIDVKALRAYLIEQLERGNQFFAGGDPRLAIRCYEAALQSFYANQDVPELLSTYQTLWSNKAMAHQQLRQYSQLREAAVIANALVDRMASLPQLAAGERRCRRCDADLTGGTNFDHPSLSVFRCPRCDYLNVTGDSAHPLPLPDALALVGSDDLAGELIDQLRDSGDGAAVLRRALQAMVERLIEWIDREPQAAAARIWWDLEHAEDILRESKASDLSRSAYTKGAALLYGLISRHGPPEIEPGIDLSNISTEIRQHVWSVAHNAALLGALLLMFLRGEFTARVEGKQISWEPTEYYLNFAEWRLNRHQEYGQRPPRTDEALDAVFEQALQLARGYTMESFVALVGEITRQVRQTLPPGKPLRLLWRQRAALTEQERRMLDDWSLTPERLRRFSEPFYFDLGQPARQPQTDVELGISLAVHSWLSYYPLVPVLRGGDPYFLVPVRVLDIALSNLGIFKSRLLEGLFEAARAAGLAASPANRKTVNALSQLRLKANRLAELRAAGFLTAAGWAAQSSVRLDDPDHPGTSEEIDLLAARRIGGRFVLLLGEVKDFDLALQRASAARNFEKRIAGACKQIERKAALIERVWEKELKQRFDLSPEPGEGVDLLAVLVMASAMPLAFFECCALLFEVDLEGLAERIEQQPELSRQVLAKGWKTLRLAET